MRCLFTFDHNDDFDTLVTNTCLEQNTASRQMDKDQNECLLWVQEKERNPKRLKLPTMFFTVSQSKEKYHVVILNVCMGYIWKRHQYLRVLPPKR